MIKVLIFLIAALLASTATAAQLACPKVTPVDWGRSQKKLESVRVMSYPITTVPGADREYYATPPWEEREKDGFIYQTWHVNRDANEFKYEVDCIYSGTARYFSLELGGVSMCTARWRTRRNHGVLPGTLEFFCKK